MKEEDVHNEIVEIEKELRGAEEDIRKSKNPFYYIIALFLLLIIVVMAIPYYNIRIDPQPNNIPQISDVVPSEIILQNNITVTKKEDYRKLFDPRDPIIKQTADRIATISCKSSSICHAKAMFYFVRDKFEYVSDPSAFEYVKSARESLSVGGGDCDDASVLLANLISAVGIRSRLAFIPSHVYVQIYLPDAADKYKDEGWINLDATCEYCDFGEIPTKNREKPKVIIDL